MNIFKSILLPILLIILAIILYQQFLRDQKSAPYLHIYDRSTNKLVLKDVPIARKKRMVTIEYLQPFEVTGVILQRYEFTAKDYYTRLAPVTYTLGTQDFVTQTTVSSMFMDSFDITHSLEKSTAATSNRSVELTEKNGTFIDRYFKKGLTQILDISVIPANEQVHKIIDYNEYAYPTKLHLKGQLVKVQIDSQYTYFSTLPNYDKEEINSGLIMWVEEASIEYQ